MAIVEVSASHLQDAGVLLTFKYRRTGVERKSRTLPFDVDDPVEVSYRNSCAMVTRPMSGAKCQNDIRFVGVGDVDGR